MEIKTFGWEETPSEIRHRIMDPADFQQDTFKRKTIPNGVVLVIGKLNEDKVPKGGNKDAMITQSLRFPIKTDEKPDGFDLESAKAWAEQNFTSCVNHDRMQGSTENMADHETVANDTMPSDGAASDEKRKAREARHQKYGIEIVDGGALTPGSGRPTDPEQYGDPVNFAYPLADLAQANNARARFKQAFSTYKDAKSQKNIHNRIVAAQIEMGGNPSYDETDARDKMLDPKLVEKIKGFSVADLDLAAFSDGSLVEYLLSKLKDEQLRAFREMADLGNAKTFQRKAVQIFSTGTWNGDKYNESDLDELARNYNELKSQIKPPLKLGHKDQLGRMDPDWNNTGQPAFGWVTNVYRDGDKLMADFNYIPQRINDLIEHRAYARLSVEISPNYAMTDPKTDKVKTYGKVLRGVALLGGDVPAVTTLADVASLYRADDSSMGSAQTVAYEMRTTIQPTTGGQPVSEKTQTESVADQATKDFAAREQALADREAAAKASEDRAKALTEENQKLRAQARDNDIAAFTASLVRDGKLLPANVESAKAGLVSAYDHEELLGSDGLKKFSETHANRGPVAIAKDMMSNVPTKVTFGEVATQPAARTEGSAPGSEGLPMTQFTEDSKGDLWFSDHKGQRFPVMNVALDKKAKSIMSANTTLTYGDALVLAEQALRSSAAK